MTDWSFLIVQCNHHVFPHLLCRCGTARFSMHSYNARACMCGPRFTAAYMIIIK